MNVLAGRVRIELVQPLDGRHALRDRAGVVLREVSDRHLVAPAHRAGVDVAAATLAMPGASDSSAFSSVVLPTPLRPMSTIFSPRLTIAQKSWTTFTGAVRLRDAGALERELAVTGAPS